jgi:TolB-like protein
MKNLATMLAILATAFTATARDDARDALAKLADSLLVELSDDTAAISRLAVLPFDDKTQNANSSRGTALGEYFVSRLRGDGRFTLVDRASFKEMIAEIELSQSDLVDESTAVEAGAMLAADAILTGTISEVFGKTRISAKIIRTGTSEVLANASVVAAPAALDGLTKELLGERAQVSSTVFRSVLVPGWGQFYSRRYVRGGISLAASAGGLGYTVYSIVKTRNARAEYDDWASKWTQDPPEGVTGPEWWGNNEDGLFYRKKDRLYREYSEQFDRAVIAGIITGGVWTLNVVDALIAGVQAKRRFEPYFALDPWGTSAVGVCVRF